MSESKENSWYYLRPNQAEPMGPVQADEMRFLFATNQITRWTLVWSTGMEDWQPLGEVGSLHKTDQVIKLKPGFLGVHGKPPTRSPPPQ
jgi:uncharacterized protein DUF4339